MAILEVLTSFVCERLSGNYDAIINISVNCRTHTDLERLGLRKLKCLTDNFAVAHHKTFIKMFDYKFKEFMRRENVRFGLSEYSDTSKTYMAHDILYDTFDVHNFGYDRNISDRLKEMNLHYNKRINEMLEYLNSDSKLLFIRLLDVRDYNSDDIEKVLEETLEIKESIDRNFKNIKYNYLLLMPNSNEIGNKLILNVEELIAITFNEPSIKEESEIITKIFSECLKNVFLNYYDVPYVDVKSL